MMSGLAQTSARLFQTGCAQFVILSMGPFLQIQILPPMKGVSYVVIRYPEWKLCDLCVPASESCARQCKRRRQSSTYFLLR